MIHRLAISGYRSLRDVQLGLERITLVTGPNGSGKSSLYRALNLLADIAQGRIIQSLAAEGGLPSTLWAGPSTLSAAMKRGEVPVEGTTRKTPVSLKLGFSSDDYGYAIDLGLPVPSGSRFSRDPDIKVEQVWIGETPRRANILAERRGPAVRVRMESGEWREAGYNLAPVDSMMTHAADQRDGLELMLLRERMRAWRFYDQLRTDRDAPARQPQIGTYTPVLAGDGANLAAAVQTIFEIGDSAGLATTVADAFGGASIDVGGRDGYFELEMQQPGLLRPLTAAELSDGTLRYLLLAAALLTPRPPELMILNEPESSLHSDLLRPLARLIATAAERSQIILVSHADGLISALDAEAEYKPVRLEKELGETIVVGEPPESWTWPSR